MTKHHRKGLREKSFSPFLVFASKQPYLCLGSNQLVMVKYKEVKFIAGSTIDSAIEQLKSQRGLSCGTFNGVLLRSDVDTVGSAYKKVTGLTKAQMKKNIQSEQEEYEQKRKEHLAAIPRLTTEFISKGNKILDKGYHSMWRKIVPVRLRDLYMGKELGCSLDIIKSLNDGCDMSDVNDMFVDQGHSGTTGSLVLSIVRRFCRRGVAFYKYTEGC